VLNRTAEAEDICWSSVSSIHQRYANKELLTRDVWKNVRYLGIDEISIYKGMKNYACCLVDLERGIVLDFLESRLKADLLAYFKKKGEQICKQIAVVSSDMWEGYTTLAGDIFPNAVSVIDRFHFFVHLNKALDSTRRLLRKEFPDEDTFKHLRWVILKSPKNLSKDEKLILQKAFTLSSELSQVYQLRKDLKQIFDTDQTILQARIAVDLWEEKAGKIESKSMKKFLQVLKNWKEKVLNFFQERLSNGLVEGINNAIRGIIRRSCGFHNFENLKRRVLVELG